jgi:hypothetical protein
LRDAISTHPKNFELHGDELGNVLGAIKWASDLNRWEDVIALGRGIDPYLTLHGLWDVWKATLASVLDAAKRGGNRAVQGWALHQMGTREIGAGQIESARSLLNQALQIRKSLGDEAGAAFTQHNLNFLGALPPTPKPKPDSGWGAGVIVAGAIVSGLAVMVGAAIIGAIILLAPGQPEKPTESPTRVVRVTDTRESDLPTHTPTPRRVTAIAPGAATFTPTRTPSSTPDKTAPDLKIGGIDPKDKVILYGSCGSKEVKVTFYAYDASGVSVEFFYKYRNANGKDTTKELPAKVKALGNDLYEATILLGTETYAALGGGRGTIEYRVIAEDKFGNVKEVEGTILLDYCIG